MKRPFKNITHSWMSVIWEFHVTTKKINYNT